jgi:hypothetical protein
VKVVDVAYLAASPQGELTLGPDDLARPFRVTPDETHPFLTLGDYLDTLRSLVLEAGPALFCNRRAMTRCRPLREDLETVTICTEKHGALYHIARVEVRAGGDRFLLCATTALSDRAKAWLAREAGILRELHHRFDLPPLPRPVRLEERPCGARDHGLSALVLLTDWFEGFHEWHLGPVEEREPTRVRIWDQTRGHRWASGKEVASLFREAARILTRLYDLGGFLQLRAWHHAAGDFVVRPRRGLLAVRLTTARRYEPLPGLGEESGLHPAVALTYFFIDAMLRMRLDREEGLGGFLWAGDDALEAAVAGFFQAVDERRGSESPLLAGDLDLAGLLRSFSPGELRTLHEPILQSFTRADPSEQSLVESRIEGHVTALHRTLRGVRG